MQKIAIERVRNQYDRITDIQEYYFAMLFI